MLDEMGAQQIKHFPLRSLRILLRHENLIRMILAKAFLFIEIASEIGIRFDPSGGVQWSKADGEGFGGTVKRRVGGT